MNRANFDVHRNPSLASAAHARRNERNAPEKSCALTQCHSAEGQKKARETEATTKRKVAEIDRKIAELDAKRLVLLGEAKAKADQLQSEAKSQKFKLAVEAFGSGEAYNKWQFAQGLPETIDLQLFYAGEGTLWTDLKGVMPTLPVTPATPAKK